MIDIIGNIVIKNEIRDKYFNASLHSLCHLTDCVNAVNITIDSDKTHHEIMFPAISKSTSPYFLNFEEDHFCVWESPELFKALINTCAQHNADVIRASFFDIENQCANHVKNVIFENNLVKIFRMNYANFQEFQKPYIRYYLGTNCIFKTDYAKQLFARTGNRPHDFELEKFIVDFEYTCAVPKIELLRAIDDDHGLDNTCMLKKPTQNFLDLMQ